MGTLATAMVAAFDGCSSPTATPGVQATVAAAVAKALAEQATPTRRTNADSRPSRNTAAQHRRRARGLHRCAINDRLNHLDAKKDDIITGHRCSARWPKGTVGLDTVLHSRTRAGAHQTIEKGVVDVLD